MPSVSKLRINKRGRSPRKANRLRDTRVKFSRLRSSMSHVKANENNPAKIHDTIVATIDSLERLSPDTMPDNEKNDYYTVLNCLENLVVAWVNYQYTKKGNSNE